MKVEFKKLESVLGARKNKDGHFIDLPYCPYCEINVSCLMCHLETLHDAPHYDHSGPH